jgi:hypothetical protein
MRKEEMLNGIAVMIQAAEQANRKGGQLLCNNETNGKRKEKTPLLLPSHPFSPSSHRHSFTSYPTS